MGNEKNLVPNSERTPEQRHERAVKMGKASGAARRRRRDMREAADLFLSLPVADGRKWNALARKGIAPEDVDNQMAMIVGLHAAACEGDARCAAVLVKLLGEETPAAAPDESALAHADELLGGVEDALE